MARRTHPIGQATRGKTALNRLRQVDVFMALAFPHVLSAGEPLVVDVGYGAFAWTTLEMYERWVPFNPNLRVLGIEIDPERVAAAQPYINLPTIDFRLGGFNLAHHTGHNAVRVIRSYNVLRQYEETAVMPALRQMSEALEEGGLLIEGTSNPSGCLVTFDVYQKRAEHLQHICLIFGTNFRAPVEPSDFQPILPKRLIHRMLDPRPQAFFQAWNESYQRARGSGKQGRQQWISAAFLLNQSGYKVDMRHRLLRRGYLIVKDNLSRP
jgi:hypothetical protein